MSKTAKSIIGGCIKGFFLGSGIGYWLAVLRLAVKKPDEAK